MNATLDESTTVPMYSPADLSRLIRLSSERGVSNSTVGRWLKQIGQHTEGELATFHELIELRVIAGLRGRGMSSQYIHRARRDAQTFTGLEHPFVTHRLLVAGRRLYMDLADAMQTLGEAGQTALREVIEQVGEELEFDNEGLAARWWPAGKDRHVVVDPRLRSGVPTVEGTGLATSILYDCYLAEGSELSAVAKLYGVDAQVVQDAVNYEEMLHAA